MWSRIMTIILIALPLGSLTILVLTLHAATRTLEGFQP